MIGGESVSRRREAESGGAGRLSQMQVEQCRLDLATWNSLVILQRRDELWWLGQARMEKVKSELEVEEVE